MKISAARHALGHPYLTEDERVGLARLDAAAHGLLFAVREMQRQGFADAENNPSAVSTRKMLRDAFDGVDVAQSALSLILISPDKPA